MTDLTIIETGEVIEQMTRVEAERITARIADKLDAIADNLEQVLPLIGEALTRRAWESLGYVSPQAYVSERFAGSLARLSPDVRRPVVAQLSAAGMSTRQIAPVVGVTHKTVVKDSQSMREVVPEVPPAPTPTKLPESPVIVGADGKNYQRPEPKEAPEPPRPKRTPLPDTARDLGLDIAKIADRAERLMSDDRFTANKNEVAARLRHHLARAVEVLADLDNAINQ